MNNQRELDFDAWLTDMDDVLERFFERVPEQLAEQLDYSPASLAVFERWLLEKYPDFDAFDTEPSPELIDGAARYVGETFVRSLGAHWTLSVENPKDVFFGLPIVTGHPHQTIPLCPHSLVGAATGRRMGHYLLMVFDFQNGA